MQVVPTASVSSLTYHSFPSPRTNVTVQFQTDPAKAVAMNELVFKGLEGIVKDGPSAEYFDKAVKNLKKAHGESLRKNSYWLGQLARFYGQGFDFVTNYDKLLDAVTASVCTGSR